MTSFFISIPLPYPSETYIPFLFSHWALSIPPFPFPFSTSTETSSYLWRIFFCGLRVYAVPQRIRTSFHLPSNKLFSSHGRLYFHFVGNFMGSTGSRVFPFPSASLLLRQAHRTFNAFAVAVIGVHQQIASFVELRLRHVGEELGSEQSGDGSQSVLDRVRRLDGRLCPGFPAPVRRRMCSQVRRRVRASHCLEGLAPFPLDLGLRLQTTREAKERRLRHNDFSHVH